MGGSEKFRHREEEVESESSREYKAFRSMVDAAGGLEKVASSVLEHTGVAKTWVYDWYNAGRTPSVNVTRQVFSELRHLVRESKANPQPAKEVEPKKPEAELLKPSVKEKPVQPAIEHLKPKSKPKLTRKEILKDQQEKRWMQDEEYAALHKSLVEKGVITPNSEEKE